MDVIKGENMSVLLKGKLVKPKPQDFLNKVIEPVLCSLSDILYSQAAAQLLLGTAIKESGEFRYRKQLGGPALSYFQIEPETHEDIWENYLKYRPVLKTKVISLMANPKADKLSELENNDSYAAAIARIKYKRYPEKIPAFNDIESMARYWKKYYNTPLGKGTTKGFVDLWNKAIGKTSLKYNKACG